jgi:glycosyltransferase involved in cell wall biosynthesis
MNKLKTKSMQNESLRIAIDLTPLKHGGENGGAKILILTLLKQFQELAHDYHFFLLTSSSNHSELIEYETNNTTCQLTLKQFEDKKVSKYSRILSKIKQKIISKLNISVYRHDSLEHLKIDLLFSPFSAPTYAQKNIPLVAIVHDLQHLEYPWFFSSQERHHRTFFLNDLVSKSQKIVCVSDFTRQSFIQNLDVPADRIAVIPNCIHERLQKHDLTTIDLYLTSLGVADRKYSFYPANYWEHKNHRFLLVAYGIYKNQFPNNHLDLVFTGALEEEERQLKEAAELMGLSKNVHFLGFLNEEELAAVWQGSSCLIFPSLYEGFGIPILEAMNFGKPILCSNAGSLPEVGSDAALYFSPRKLDEIVNCLAKVTNDEIVVKEIVARGHRRLEMFNSKEMALQYLEVFKTVALDREITTKTMISNVYHDGWSAPKFNISVAPGTPERELVIVIEVPGFYPASQAKIQLKTQNKKATYKCNRATLKEIVWSLSDCGEVINVQISPYFVPSALNINSDDRQLGLIVRSCQIRSIDGICSQILDLESLA